MSRRTRPSTAYIQEAEVFARARSALARKDPPVVVEFTSEQKAVAFRHSCHAFRRALLREALAAGFQTSTPYDAIVVSHRKGEAKLTFGARDSGIVAISGEDTADAVIDFDTAGNFLDGVFGKGEE